MNGSAPRVRASAVRGVLIRWGVPIGVLALNVGAVAAEMSTGGVGPGAAGAYAAAVLTAAALFARARRPVATAAAILIVCLGYHLAGYPGQGPAFALFVAAYSIPVHARRLAWSLPAGIATGVLWSLIPPLPPHPVSWLDWAVLGPALGMSTFAVVGAILTLSARQTAAEHAAQAAQARAGIARDVHDVLAHTISAITVQANLALDALDDDPALARAAMERARDLARAATPQLRHSLLRLRHDGRPEEPQPTLAMVGQVLDDARAAGLDVLTRIDEETGRLDPVAQLTAMRIVQEAVTNVVRHSGGTRLDCTIALRDGALVVEIVDDGVRSPGPEGLGITGMRERAAAVGGTLDAGPTSTGYRVTATIPLADARRSS